ncbi:MAG: FtsW/RodA/SpoVE family cell cycle protein [Ferruginibacter sp.]
MMKSLLTFRKTERIFIGIICLVLAALFYQVYNSIQKQFYDVESRIVQGSIVNLNDRNVAGKIKVLLEKEKYLRDEKDINFIADAVAKARLVDHSVLDNIGELNKSLYAVNASIAFSNGGDVMKKRAMSSQQLLGFVNADSLLFASETTKPLQTSSEVDLGMGTETIDGIIVTKENTPASSALVRLQLVVSSDSNYNTSSVDEGLPLVQFSNAIRKTYFTDSAGKPVLQSFAAYARTDANGHFTFKGLSAGKGYSVLPLQPGFQFGSSQGTASLSKPLSLKFFRAEHKIKLFSTKDFASLKKDKAFIVRTPAEVNKYLFFIVIVFFAAFILLHLLLSWRFPLADEFIIPVIMLLTGISFLTLLSIQDPLRDRFLGRNTAFYFVAGIVTIIIMLFINLKKFTPDSWLFRLLIFKRLGKAANGWPWALAAAGLLLMTILFGTGPEGSGVKVNLFGFQPSEIVKYLLIIFLAGFFTINEKFIAGYATWNKRFSFFALAIGAIGLCILLFLILGDLGPAMVCCFSFIILFSFSRGDFLQMAGTVLLYILSLWISKNEWLAIGITIGCMVLYMLLGKKKLSESSIMALVILSSFMLLDKVPYLDKLFPGPIARLTDRKAIWQNPWDNEVYGGDQIANGIWAMSSGGITGQGAGEGFAKTIPEAHTDMILPSMGEEFGLAGMICIFILFLLYLHRSVIIGRQTGRPFLFYLSAGIGISSFIQFILIAGGSIGALPLSGVALPFMSYGGSSLLINLMAAGFLLSASVLRGSSVQMRFITSTQDKNLVPAIAAAIAGVVLLSVAVSKYIFNNKHWVVEPALVADRSGARMFSYNPRISILMNRLQAGNLYDRNGKLLATSHPELLNEQSDSLLALGFSKEYLSEIQYKREDRYYPFSSEMFFWIGDANTGIFTGGNNGYFAEYRHAAELRGFPAPLSKFQVTASKYREEKFLPQQQTEMMVSKRDFSALAPLLLAGINSDEVKNFKKQDRDVYLTLDAALQTSLQHSLSTDDSVRIKRVSVVVLNDSTGDVLTSAAWPLPPSDDYERMSSLNPLQAGGWDVNSDIGFAHATQPGSTAKLATAMAAFNKLGMAAASKTILVHPWDLIRTKGLEPDEAGNINIERAIVKSNNSFFIRLANEEQLQEEMGTVYLQTGMFLHGVGGYFYETEPNKEQEEKWRQLWRKTEFSSIKRYNRDNIRPARARGVSGMAWGQGELVATPASVARLAAAIANNGSLMPNRFVKSVAGKTTGLNAPVIIAKDPAYAQLLKSYMLKQSQNKQSKLGIYVAGKTGTPERILNSERINDGWYVFFAPDPKGGHTVVCIRLEAAKGSSEAVRLAGTYVIPELLKRGYIRSFDPPAGMKPVIKINSDSTKINVVLPAAVEDSL